MSQLGKFQMTEAYNWGGLTTVNHLGALFGQQQQLFSKTMIKILANTGLNNLDTVLARYPVKRLETEDDFTWKMIGNDERNVPLLSAYVDPSSFSQPGTGSVGVGGTTIYLVFAEKIFSEANVIVGEKNEAYQFRILNVARTADGTGWTYETQLMGQNALGVPYTEVAVGKRFSKDFSPVEDTMSIKGGDISFSSPIEMRQSFTTLRTEHKVPGNMLNRRVATVISTVDDKGQKQDFTAWMQYVEWMLERKWSQEKARAHMYSRTNRGADGTYSDYGKSGFIIKQGSGIREQMEVSQTTFYNDFSLTQLEGILSDMVEGKVELSQRQFVIRTGTRGASQFSKAVTDIAAGWVNLRGGNHPALIKQTPSELHPLAMSAGYQFVEWFAPNNIHIKLEVDAMYDDKVRNKILHPKGGVAESYRYDILYMGSEDEPNIQRVETAMPEHRGYLSGFRNPWTGESTNMSMGTMEDSATYTRYCNQAVVVLDPSRTATLLPTILA